MLAIEKMIAIDKADCAGCYACANKCPVQAIAMVEDEEGFRYPQVAREKCIDCGACTSSCLAGALSIQAPDWKLKFDPDKCVVCKLCLGSCPLGLFEIEFA